MGKTVKSNPYDPSYVMNRDNCSYDEAIITIEKLKKRISQKGKRYTHRVTPYQVEYWIQKEGCSEKEAEIKIKEYKANKATTLPNFIRKHGEEQGRKLYEEWMEKSLVKGHKNAKINGKAQSKFSPAYYVKNGCTELEAEHMAKEYQYKNSPLHLEYYLKRGKSFEDAKDAIRKIHDTKLGRDSYREKLINTTNLTDEEIDEEIRRVRGSCTLEVLGEEKFKLRIEKMRKTFENKGHWIPIDEVSEYEIYKREVYSITKRNDLTTLENHDKRAKAGIDGGYHLDHRYSISRGYIDGIPAEIIGSIVNLEIIPWEENLAKKENCSISKEELLYEFKLLGEEAINED